MDDQILQKITHQNQNQHITMCPCIKFQTFCRTSDYGNKFAQKNMSDKNFGKININIATNI